MRALQVLRVARQSGRNVTAAAAPRPWSGRAVVRSVVVLAAAVGGLLWWWAVLRLAVRPEAAGPWQTALVAGGWSLGLIPLHAVPRAKAGGDPAALSAPQVLADYVRPGRLSPDAGFRGCVMPGHCHPAEADDLVDGDGEGGGDG
jgi:hypothetical protein